MGKTSITVEQDTLNEFNELKNRYAINGRASADGFVNHLMDVYEDAHNQPTENEDPLDGLDSELEATKADIEQVKELVDRVPERTANKIMDDLR